MKNLLIAFLMSVTFFSCKSQPKELNEYKTIYFSDSVRMFNDGNDTVPKIVSDKFLLVVKDSTLYVVNETKKKAYEIHFLGCTNAVSLIWPDAAVNVYVMRATVNLKDTTIFTIAFYANDPNNRVHSFGTKLDDGKIYIIKLKRPKNKDGTYNL